jgi:hypothetical protein
VREVPYHGDGQARKPQVTKLKLPLPTVVPEDIREKMVPKLFPPNDQRRQRSVHRGGLHQDHSYKVWSERIDLWPQGVGLDSFISLVQEWRLRVHNRRS